MDMAKPIIRFKGYQDDWEQRKLSEIALQTYGGGTPKTANEEFWKGNIPWIQSSDLIEERLFNVKPRKYISQEAISKSATKLVPQNSVAIVTRVGVGKLAFMPFSYATSQDFLSLSELKIEPEFAVYALYKMMRLVSNEVQGTSIKGITKDELLAKEILIPDCEEQKKIGAYLHNLDHLITLHQRKCDETKKLKKYMLQKMFPQNGEKVPEIRFSGFTDDWEQRKLGDVVDSVDTGKSRFDKEGSSGEYPILGSTSVIGYDDEYDYEGDFILTARVGANAGSLYRHAGKVKISDNTVFIQASQNIEFLYQLLIQFDIKKLSFGTGQPLVKASELKSLELMMPTDMKEQMRIGVYFKNLDTLITLHQRELENLQNIKKFMLGKMFV